MTGLNQGQGSGNVMTWERVPSWRIPVTKGQQCGALMFNLFLVWTFDVTVNWSLVRTIVNVQSHFLCVTCYRALNKYKLVRFNGQRQIVDRSFQNEKMRRTFSFNCYINGYDLYENSMNKTNLLSWKKYDFDYLWWRVTIYKFMWKHTTFNIFGQVDLLSHVTMKNGLLWSYNYVFVFFQMRRRLDRT